MTDLSALKQRVYTQLQALIQEKVAQAEKAVAAAIEARDGETKSSAGDKFETGRAMMQLEQQRHEVQLSKAFQLSDDLDRLDLEADYLIVKPGALVETDRDIYFIGIGVGKIKIDHQVIFCISIQSPIGKLLLHKKKNEVLKFQEKKITIIEIV